MDESNEPESDYWVQRAANKKAKQLEQTKKCDVYTPQKYYDEIVDKIDSSNSEELEDTLKKLKFPEEDKRPLFDKFIYNYFDKIPLFYLETKANKLSLNVPKKFEKHEHYSRNEVKKIKIIELLVEAKWRIQTKKEKQVNDWKSMAVPELKAVLKEKGLHVEGTKAELVKICEVQISKPLSLVVGLEDFKLDRMDLIIKKLKHKVRRVRRAAAFALPHDVVFQNLEDRNWYRIALQESLQNVVRDLRNGPKSWVFTSKYVDPAVTIRDETETIMERLDKLDEGDWESAMKVKKGLEEDDTKVQLRLVKAKGLFDEGLIDKDEYKKMKKDILDG